MGGICPIQTINQNICSLLYHHLKTEYVRISSRHIIGVAFMNPLFCKCRHPANHVAQKLLMSQQDKNMNKNNVNNNKHLKTVDCRFVLHTHYYLCTYSISIWGGGGGGPPGSETGSAAVGRTEHKR